MADKVGKETGLVTNYGRPVYEMEDGSRVSEMSDTFKYKGKIINIPTIHGGRQYSQNELIKMLDANDIKPTSTHSTFEEAEKAARERSDNMTMHKAKASGGVMMAQQGQTILPMTQVTSAPQGGGPKAANPAAVKPLVAPQQQAPRPGEVDPRDGAVQEVAQEMQKKQAPAPQPAPVMAQPQIGGLAAPAQQMAPPMMAKGGMKDDAPEGLAVMIGLGAPTPSYEEAAEGNPPPGATKEEVADDQLVLLSEGELVVPANVVRFHGLGTYEGMRREALMGLQQMENSGQIEYVSGGAEKADPIDDNGGLVKAQAGVSLAGAPLSPIGGFPLNPPNPGLIVPGMIGPGDLRRQLPGAYPPPRTPIVRSPEEMQRLKDIEAASARFVTTPNNQTTPTVPATSATSTTPLGRQPTPVIPTETTSIVAPNVGQYTQSQDPGTSDPDPDPPADPCPPGYKMNADTGVCEPVAPPTAAPRAREDDPSDSGEQPVGATAVFGGTSQDGRLVGSTSYDFSRQSSEGSGFGILGALLGGSDQVVLTDRNTGRKAVMAKSTYEAMKADRTNPENNAFIQQLMDTQALIDADYARSRPDQGMFSDITGNKKRNYETTTAKGMAEGLGLDYTGQSLAEIMIIAEAQGQTGSDTTATTTTPTTGAVASTALGAPDPSYFGALSGAVTGGPTAGYQPGLTAVTQLANEELMQLNKTFSGIDTQAELAFGRPSNRQAPVSIAEQMKALELMREGKAGSFERTDGSKVSFGGIDNMQPGTRLALDIKRNQLEQSMTPDARRRIIDEGIDEEAAAFESGFYDEQRVAERNAAAQRAAGEERERVMERARAGDFDDSFNPTPAERYRANKAVADAEARKQARDRGADEETARRTTAVTDSQGNPVRQGGDGPNAGTVVTSGPEKEDDDPGKSIVCTEMYRQTQLEDWARTMKIWDTYQKKYLTPLHEVGYHYLFKPYVRGMQNSGILTNVGAFFAQKRTQHLRHVLTKGRAKDSFVGNVWCKIIHPIVYLVGKMVYKK